MAWLMSAGLMLYLFIGALIGLATGGADDDTYAWVVFTAAFWPAVIIVGGPVVFAISIYEKYRRK